MEALDLSASEFRAHVLIFAPMTVSGSELSCTPSSSCVVLNIIEVGATVRDSAGNGCGTHVAVVNTSPPSSTHFVVPVTHVFKVTTYDPTTGIGDQSLTEYSGGSCNGAIFINTLNLKPETSGVLHFAVSEGGNRIDNVVTQLNIGSPPSPAIGFSLTFTERSQSSQNQQ